VPPTSACMYPILSLSAVLTESDAGKQTPAVIPSGPARPPGLPPPPSIARPPGLVHPSGSQSTISSTESSSEYEVFVTPSESQEQQLAALSLRDDEVIIDDPKPVVNLWADPPKPTLPEEPLCPMHNRVCKKGICAVYADLLKKIEKDERQRGTARPYTGPYNIKVAEREERERKEREEREKRMNRRTQPRNPDGDEDGFTTAGGKKRRGGGKAWAGRGRGLPHQGSTPAPTPGHDDDDDNEESPW
jgi:hypothetical protein